VSRVIPYDPPVRAGVRCRHCAGEIEAVERRVRSLELQGLNEYAWRHVATGLETCTRVSVAAPYDGWDATRRVEGVREATP
jgi:hypothetical protein